MNTEKSLKVKDTLVEVMLEVSTSAFRKSTQYPERNAIGCAIDCAHKEGEASTRELIEAALAISHATRVNTQHRVPGLFSPSNDGGSKSIETVTALISHYAHEVAYLPESYTATRGVSNLCDSIVSVENAKSVLDLTVSSMEVVERLVALACSIEFHK